MTKLSESTTAAIDALMRVDASADAATRRAYAAALRLPPDELARALAARQTAHEPIAPRLLRRAEVARRLALSVRAVDKLAAAGILAKFRLPGRTRAAGFLEADVHGLLCVRRSDEAS